LEGANAPKICQHHPLEAGITTPVCAWNTGINFGIVRLPNIRHNAWFGSPLIFWYTLDYLHRDRLTKKERGIYNGYTVGCLGNALLLGWWLPVQLNQSKTNPLNRQQRLDEIENRAYNPLGFTTK
jgi:hypothetical protein